MMHRRFTTIRGSSRRRICAYERMIPQNWDTIASKTATPLWERRLLGSVVPDPDPFPGSRLFHELTGRDAMLDFRCAVRRVVASRDRNDAHGPEACDAPGSEATRLSSPHSHLT